MAYNGKLVSKRYLGQRQPVKMLAKLSIHVWQWCTGVRTMSKVHSVTSHFILEQRIIVYKEVEHCFHNCAAVCTGI
jgi:hypothetical protein